MTKIDDLWLYDQAVQKVAKIDARVKSTPNRARLNKLYAFLAERQAQVSGITKQVEAKREALNRMAAQCRELEHQYRLELSEFEIMSGDEECTAAEMTESRRDIENLMDQLGAARKELMGTLSFLEKASASYRDTYAKAGRAKKEYNVVRALCEEETKQAGPEREKAVAEAEKRRAGIDPALLKRYNAIRSHHARPMALVENSQCGGCRMSLPTATVKKVNLGREIVECENCGRILYAKR